MDDLEFEWDDVKARSNRAKHGVDFEGAKRAFLDLNAIEEIDTDDDSGEERWTLTGMADGRMLVVVYTARSDRIRIVSARQANRHEQDHYYRSNAP